MKRLFAPLLIALAVAGLSLGQAAATREIPKLSSRVTIVSGPKGIELDSALRAAAESAGLIYLSRDVPERTLKLNVRGLPFDEVWDLLMKTYGDNVDNVFIDERIVVVAPHPVVSRILAQGGLTPQVDPVEIPNAVIEVLPVREYTGLYEALAGLFPEVTITKLDDPPALVVKGLPERIEEVKDLLNKAGVLIEGDLATLLEDEEARKREWSLAVFYLKNDPTGSVEPTLQALQRVAPNASFTYVPAAQALVSKGSIEELVEAKGLLDRLGLLRTRNEIERTAMRTTRVYDLGTGMEAGAAIIEEIVGDRGIVNYDEKSGYLYVYAAPGAHDEIEQAVAEFHRSMAENETVEPEPGSTLLYYETRRPPSYVADYIAKVLTDVKLVPMDDAGLLMVVGSPDAQRRVARMLDEIDRPNPTAEEAKKRADQLRKELEPVHATYEVAYHNAEALARLLSQILGSGNGEPRTGDGGPNPDGTTASPLRVSADPQTNTLLVFGPRRSVRSALELARKLDRPADQVVSRVWIQEVDRNAAGELGIDWQYATGKFAVSFAGGGLTAGYDSSATALSALAQSLRLLEKTGRSRRLLDANTLTLNAEPTTLLSGGKLLLPKQGGGVNGEGQDAEGGTAYEEFNYGLNLVLTPFTSPDGTVTLDIATTVGSLPQSGPTPGSVLIPQSFAESRIRVKDGQAVILGGVIANEDRNDVSGVPVLKDIPVVGALFRTSERVKSERILLIIVQTHILKAEGGSSEDVPNLPESKLPSGEYAPQGGETGTSPLPEGQLPTEPWSDRATRVAPIGGEE